MECDSIPCPPGHDRVHCRGRSQGECVRGWFPDAPPPEEIVWSEHWIEHTCIDDGTDVENVDHRFLYPRGLVRLAACGEGNLKGSYKLPMKGRWLLQFYVGVPTYQAKAKIRPAAYPHDREGPPDPTDSVLVRRKAAAPTIRPVLSAPDVLTTIGCPQIDINGLEDTYLNKPTEQEGSKLLYYKVLILLTLIRSEGKATDILLCHPGAGRH